MRVGVERNGKKVALHSWVLHWAHEVFYRPDESSVSTYVVRYHVTV